MSENISNKINVRVKDIFKSLKKNDLNNVKNIGAINGLSGLSLFYFYYGNYFKDDESYQYGNSMIEKSLDNISNGYNDLSFCYGIAGYGWTIDHLSQKGFIDVNSDEFLPNFDELLFNKMISNMKSNNYDFLHGALGQGMYFLNRYKNTKEHILKIKYKKILTRLVTELLLISEETENELKWYMFEDFNSSKEKIYNLSLSHGQASIVSFLSRLLRLDSYFLEMVEQLLRKSVYFLQKHQATSNGSSLFPNWIKQNSESDYNSRLSWCYGDLGIAVSLWNAAEALKDVSLKNQVIDIFKFNAKRRDLNKCRILDAGICHGSFGIAKIYGYIYNETKVPLFLETRDFWIKIGLSQGKENEYNSGYQNWIGGINKEAPWRYEVNLLEGISGIGLNLLDFMNGENNWDECILLN